MTTTSDWPHGVDPMPSIEPSSDLFDGDILGDELIDIYNAAVVGGGDESMDEIPNILSLVPSYRHEKKDESTQRGLLHPGEAVDDGLGAFRPSTSFNDLTTLLPTNLPANHAKSSSSTPVVPTTTISGNVVDPKKRPHVQSIADGPAAKRKAAGSRKTSTPPKTKSKTGTANKSIKGGSMGKQGTPNPLTTGGQVAIAPTGGIKPQTLKPLNKPSSSPSATPQSRLAKVEPVEPLVLVPTEADFKSVAQAAVSNLIANAGSKTDNLKKPTSLNNDDTLEIIDTSTEHIKALTGSNWVTVCSDGQSVNSASDKMNNRARRQNLTPDERARQNRDRNREHARNTRLRKKAYVDELKRTLTALVSQRDAVELEKRQSAQRDLEQREVRFRVVEEFLKLRGRNELNYARWAAILEDSFTMTLPNTDYRDTATERGQYEQSLSGVGQAMSDSSMFAGFLQTLVKVNSGHPISFVYNCDRKNFFMDNCTAVLYWTASSNGAVGQGAPAELNIRGNATAKFSPASNKLVSVALSFDTGSIISQINHVFKYAAYTDLDEVDDGDAQVAADNADAILDSLQMPHIATSSSTTVSSNNNNNNNNNNKAGVVPVVSAASITDGEKSDSSDESNGEV